MTFTALPLALDELTAAKLAALIVELRPVTASKAAATSRNTTTTFTADPDLALALGVGTWELDGDLFLSSAADAAGDFNYRWAWTNTMSVVMGGSGPHLSLASGSNVVGEWTRNAPDTTTPSVNFPFGCSVAGVNAPIKARIVVSVAGTLTLEWTQQASNANNTTLEAGSYITARLVA